MNPESPLVEDSVYGGSTFEGVGENTDSLVVPMNYDSVSSYSRNLIQKSPYDSNDRNIIITKKPTSIVSGKDHEKDPGKDHETN